MVKWIIWKFNLVAFTTLGFDFDEFKLGGLHAKHAIAAGNLGTTSTLAWRQRKTKKTGVEMAGRRTSPLHTDI
jgi:hypothetical protein